MGTTRPLSPGCRADSRTTAVPSLVVARLAPISEARVALAIHRSKRASASMVSSRATALAATNADSSSRMRAISACSATCASRQAFPSSTATRGSTKRVWPLPDASWTMPLTRERASALTGTT